MLIGGKIAFGWTPTSFSGLSFSRPQEREKEGGGGGGGVLVCIILHSTSSDWIKGFYEPTREYESTFGPLPSPNCFASQTPSHTTLCVLLPTLSSLSLPPLVRRVNITYRIWNGQNICASLMYWSAVLQEKFTTQWWKERAKICIFVTVSIYYNSFTASRIHELKRDRIFGTCFYKVVWSIINLYMPPVQEINSTRT